MNKIKFFTFLLKHPLNIDHKWTVLLRYLRWQVGSRLAPGAVAVDFVDKTRLLVKPGMTGATGNIYTGLHEFEDMAFVLHILRQGDCFVDIGANIGSYTVLAGGAVGVNCISVEPIPDTFDHLRDNINLNGMRDRVTALNVGVGEKEGVLRFTSSQDTVNHVLSEDEAKGMPSMEVPVQRLDDILNNVNPVLIKIDVEGFESNVIKGANSVLSKDSLLGVIMELNGSGRRYGFDESVLHETMLSYGFSTYTYAPFERQLKTLANKTSNSGNTLYVRNCDEVNERLKSSQAYQIINVGKKL
ncbi:MAG: FkbM family methyltransferase [Zetaproteobacteria bacterium]|nr:FkbM family methyltransferase [Zetaproteobacteria bacterium]